MGEERENGENMYMYTNYGTYNIYIQFTEHTPRPTPDSIMMVVIEQCVYSGFPV